MTDSEPDRPAEREIATMSKLPVNATSEPMARRIAFDAAANLAPKGMRLDVGDLVAIEEFARPFDRVALEEANTPSSRMHTYVFEVTVEREPGRCESTYNLTLTLNGKLVRCELPEGHEGQHGHSFAARYWD